MFEMREAEKSGSERDCSLDAQRIPEALRATDQSGAAVKTCLQCGKEKTLTEFGINRYYLKFGAKDGRQVYCKPCIIERVNGCRERVRAKRQARIKVVLPQIPPPEVKREYQIELRVLAAVRSGADTIPKLARQLRLPIDTVGDVVAVLMLDREEIKHKRVAGEVQLYVRKAA